MEHPLILLTNDDGVDSPHLLRLGEHLQESLAADVLVLAPERQRSAMSHSITLHKPLRVEERSPMRYAVSGSPVDCVYVGVMKVARRRPSLVISGPNDGFNLGTDVFYSGTVGAAVEGGLRGVPGMAVSVDRGGDDAVDEAAQLVATLAERMIHDPLPAGTVLNVNVPTGCEGRVRWTHLGKRFYEDDVHERQDPRGRNYYWIGGGIAGVADLDGSDCQAVYAGIASITPLQLDLTHHELLSSGTPSWNLGKFEEH
jgi:5'-nucleotidase